MIFLGVVLLVLGFVMDIGILVTLGIILLAVGALFVLLGAVGRPIGGRSHYW